MSKLIKMFMSASGLSEMNIRSIIATAPLRYKTYSIPKRNGGARTISQPAKEVKFLQRVIVENILNSLPVHQAATAYCKGISIKDNASVHVGSGAILKLDFKDFFPSIVADDWKNYCKKNGVFDNDFDILASSLVLFKKNKYGSHLRLAIGAPSSPMLSNVLMYDFDRMVSLSVARDKVRYTRYADDLTFSALRAGNLSNVEKDIRGIMRDIEFPKIRINEEKTVFSTKKYRRVVTGLVLSDNGTVSIGRDRKREIRAAIHHYTLNSLNDEDIKKLAGLLAFVHAVEPEFLRSMINKYGIHVIENIKHGKNISQG